MYNLALCRLNLPKRFCVTEQHALEKMSTIQNQPRNKKCNKTVLSRTQRAPLSPSDAFVNAAGTLTLLPTVLLFPAIVEDPLNQIARHRPLKKKLRFSQTASIRRVGYLMALRHQVRQALATGDGHSDGVNLSIEVRDLVHRRCVAHGVWQGRIRSTSNEL